MGFDPLTLAIGGAAVSAATSAVAAQRQNAQIGKSMRSAQQSAQLEREAATKSADLEMRQRRNEADRIRGLISVSAAERGVGMGGSVEALQRQADYDQALNEAVIDTNLYYQTKGIEQGYKATTNRLRSQGAMPVVQALLGGLSGFSTGLQIGNGLQSMRVGADVPTPSTTGSSINTASSGATTLYETSARPTKVFIP